MKVSNGVSRNKELDELYRIKANAIEKDDEAEAQETEEKIKHELLDLERKEFEKKLQYLDELQKKKGSSAAIYKLKEKILGSKKGGQEAVSMEDPETGQTLVEKKGTNRSISKVCSKSTNK